MELRVNGALALNLMFGEERVQWEQFKRRRLPRFLRTC